MKRRLIIAMFCAMLTVTSIPVTAYADDVAESVLAKSFVQDEGYIAWEKSDPMTLYRGQYLFMDFSMADTWVECYTIPKIEFRDPQGKQVYKYYSTDPGWIASVGCSTRYSACFNVGSANLADGKYVISLAAMPCYEDASWIENYEEAEIPEELITVNVKKLPKPTYVTATAGKKQCVIKFRKSTGATKYEIYRSTKKSSGYKKIATITGNKYTDKKVTKGKRYYYKIKAKRGTSSTGIAYSYYTTPKRSAKIK